MIPSYILAFLSLASAAVARTIPRENGGCTNPAVRKEWHEITDAEKAEYERAVQCLRELPSKDYAGVDAVTTRLDDLVYTYRMLANETHSLAKFLPWRRWFIQLHENILSEECGFTGTQPYWDWTIDKSQDMNINDIETYSEMSNKLEALLNAQVRTFAGDEGRNSSPDEPLVSRQQHTSPGKQWQPWQGGKVRSITDDEGTLFSRQQHTSPGKQWQPWQGGKVRSVADDESPSSSPEQPLDFLQLTYIDHQWAEWQNGSAVRMTEYTGFNDVDGIVSASIDDMMPVLKLSDVNPVVKDYMNTQGGLLCYTYSNL